MCKKPRLHTASYFSPIGNLFIIAGERALLRIDFEDERLQEKIKAVSVHNLLLKVNVASFHLHPVLLETKNWLDAYFDGNNLPPAPSIYFEDTPFRMLVWKMLLHIPYGQTISYKELACMVAKERGIKRMSAQAIGQAVGHNPISIIVPCHRVIGSKGELTGYGGGLIRKKFLLELENRK